MSARLRRAGVALLVGWGVVATAVLGPILLAAAWAGWYGVGR